MNIGKILIWESSNLLRLVFVTKVFCYPTHVSEYLAYNLPARQ
jgi:hypothetical protein